MLAGRCRQHPPGDSHHDDAPPPGRVPPRRTSRSAIASDTRRRQVVDDPAVGQEHDTVGVRRGHRIVGDHDDGLPVGVDRLAEQGQHLRGGARVQRAGRLVAEDHLGAYRERAGDGDALLLAAGQLRRAVPQPALEADPLHDLGQPAAVGPGVREPGGQQDVLAHGQRRDEVERLEDEADAGAALLGQRGLGQLRQVRPGQPHGAVGRPVQARRAVQQRALARPGRAHHRGEGAAEEVDVTDVQSTYGRGVAPVDLPHSAQGDGGVTGHRSGPGRALGQG